ncbi:MAG: CsiV family protein [Halioglobus sp.]
MITNDTSRFTAAFASLLALFVVAPSRSEEPRWFKVELMVFSQETQARYREEQWAPFPELAYPEQGRFLVEPVRVEANLGEYDGFSEIDELGRQIIYLEEPPRESEDIPYSNGSSPGAAGAGLTDEGLASGAETGEDGESAAPQPFVVLPASELEFAAKTAYMRRHGPYRILFHQAWLQPFREGQDGPSIILDRSGDEEQWPRLQGSIRLSLSRYLHLETNLWLNTTGEYLPGQWRMPAPPLAPPSLIVEGLVPEAETAEEPYFVTPEDEAVIAGDSLQEPEDAYPFRHAVLLKQKRRMRSEEVHYLDHPLLGVVVKMTPYEWEAGDRGIPPDFPAASGGLSGTAQPQ